MIAQIFIPSAELTIPLKTPTNEGNAEIKTQPIIAETKVFKVFKLIQRPTHFLCFSLIKTLYFFLHKGQFFVS